MHLKLFIILLLFIISASRSYAGGDDITVVQGGGDATELTQLLNNALLKENSNYQESILDSNGQQLLKQAEMVAGQLTQINDMARNSKMMPNHSWSKTSSLL